MTTFKRVSLAIAVLACIALVGGTTSVAHASSWGFGTRYGSQSNWGHSNHYRRGQSRGYGHYDYHDTSHYDWHRGGFQRHGNHFHYTPGHYDYHQSGHYDYHRGY